LFERGQGAQGHFGGEGGLAEKYCGERGFGVKPVVGQQPQRFEGVVAHVAAEIGVDEQVLGRWVRLQRQAAEAGDTAEDMTEPQAGEHESDSPARPPNNRLRPR